MGYSAMGRSAIATPPKIMEHYQSLAQDLAERESESVDAWVTRWRRGAMDHFRANGFPSMRNEDWRFTNLRTLATMPFLLEASATGGDGSGAASAIPPLQPGSIQLVFFNGRLLPECFHPEMLPVGIQIKPLSEVLRDAQQPPAFHRPVLNALDAINVALAEHGVSIRVSEGVHVESPVELLYVTGSEVAAHTQQIRNQVHCEAASHLTVVERFVSTRTNEHPYFNNVVTDVVVEQAANLDHNKLQDEASDGFHFSTMNIEQKASSEFSSHYFSFGGSLVRNEINVSLNGEHCECVLNGAYSAHDSQHMDQRTRVDHAMPNCNSYESYKGILSDQSHAVFNGRIVVHPDAQKTDAKQSNQVILQSRDAVIDTQPQLEIYADDVKCTHGATVGELDEDALNYLRSRGIPIEQARSMLIFAFVNEVVQNVSVEGLRTDLEQRVFHQDSPEVVK